MEFRVLGPVEALAGNRLLRIGGPKERSLLSILLVHANQVVPVDQLIDQLWDGDPPGTAPGTLHGYVSRLRHALDPGRGQGAKEDVLVTRPPGYLVAVAPGALDLDVFEQLVEQGRTAGSEGNPHLASAVLRDALALWRGPALADIPLAAVRQTVAHRLEENRLAALEERIQADLDCGRHTQLVGELEGLVGAFPLRERLRGQLMLALYRSGRQAEALQAYRDTRRALVEGLGLEPGVELRRLERAILAAGAALDYAASEAIQVGARATLDRVPEVSVGPRQLPPDIADFTAREDAIARVRVLFETGHDQDTAVTICVITGKAGVGKSTLAVRVAHQLQTQFIDGQLYANLRSTRDRKRCSLDVLAQFLRALGIDASAVPQDGDERTALYRTRFAGRRMLVLLDDASDETQIRPLLPGGPPSAVLVTSRSRLSGLPGATQVDLDVLSPDQAIELVGKIAGHQRVAAESDAAIALARLCGWLPLALRIVGAKLAAKRHWRLATLAERLGDERRRLDELRIGDLEVRASIALSYRGVQPDERWAFRMLGMLDAKDFAPWLPAALLDVPVAIAEDLAERLVDAQLLEIAGQDPSGQTRYRLHDLLRLYARERVLGEESEPARRAALERALGARLAERADPPVRPGPNQAGTTESITITDRAG
jgi:DNA-binding SARP family transcriptional activator